MYTKILLCGASGTGKTTVLNKFKEEGFDVVTEVVRTLVKEKGIKINEMGDEEGQKIIFDAVDESVKNDYIVADRCWVDVLAYTAWSVKQETIDKSIMMPFIEHFIDSMTYQENNVLFVYFPIEFPVTDDGVRSTDEEYRKSIDIYIKGILKESGYHYITVHGTPEERVEQIKKAVRDSRDSDYDSWRNKWSE